MREDIKSALEKCATGFGTSETVEEFSVEDGELRLVKRKVTTKDIPPDIKAVKLLLEESDCSALSDGRLEEERQMLCEMLKEYKID